MWRRRRGIVANPRGRPNGRVPSPPTAPRGATSPANRKHRHRPAAPARVALSRCAATHRARSHRETPFSHALTAPSPCKGEGWGGGRFLSPARLRLQSKLRRATSPFQGEVKLKTSEGD